LVQKSIEVVCRLNVARSPFLQAFLSRHFPDIDLSSSGTDVDFPALSDPRVLSLADKWGFSFTPKMSKKIEGASNHILFPVDGYVRERLSILGFTNRDLVPESTQNSFYLRNPQDPIGLNDSQISFELAILLSYAVHSLRTSLDVPEFESIELKAMKSSNFAGEELTELLRMTKARNAYIVNCCFKNNSIHSLLERQENTQDLLSLNEASSVFSSRHEILEAEKFLCSTEWRNWLMDLSRKRPVILISPPFKNSAGNFLLDSVLTGIWATEVSV